MYKLLLVICLLLSNVGYSQCKNSIKLENATKKAGQDRTGSINVSVISTDEYLCTLFTENGSGAIKIEEKRGNGNMTINFSNLDTNVIHLVQFEFLSEENKFCRKLQKSGITFEEK